MKAKECKYTDCHYPPWSGGFCKYHQIKKTTFKKGKKKTGELPLFMELWLKSDKKSMISGRDLKQFQSSNRFVNMFAHLLPKGSYPSYRLNPHNIWIVHPDEHYLIDHSTKMLRARYEKEYDCTFEIFYKMKEELRQEYRDSF